MKKKLLVMISILSALMVGSVYATDSQQSAPSDPKVLTDEKGNIVPIPLQSDSGSAGSSSPSKPKAQEGAAI